MRVRGAGSAQVAATANLEEEVVVLCGKRRSEWHRHRMVVHREYRNSARGIHSDLQEQIGALQWDQRAFDFVQCPDEDRPQPVCAKAHMHVQTAIELGFQIVGGLRHPLLEHGAGELGAAAIAEIGDEGFRPMRSGCAAAKPGECTHGPKAMCKAVPVLEAILLVGGQGTRLRPLTIDTPKPMLPVAGRPCTEHQIARLREAGVTRIILGTSYRAEVFARYFGDGSAFGVELVCVTEQVPLGTGGAIRNVLSELKSGPDDPVLILNGDVLSGHDMVGQIAQHRSRNADVTLHLINVEDPRPFGLVPTDSAGRVLAFLEKPQRPEEIVTHQINAGCYVFTRRVIDAIPGGRVVSVERETFPGLLAAAAPVYGWIDDAYWLDLGNPLAFAQGSRDLVSGRAPSAAVTGGTGASLVLDGAVIAASATVDGGSCIGEGAHVAAGALVRGSVVMEGAVIAAGSQVIDSIIGREAVVGARTSVVETVVADRARIGSDNEFGSGTRIFPDAVIGDTAVRLSSDRS